MQTYQVATCKAAVGQEVVALPSRGCRSTGLSLGRATRRVLTRRLQVRSLLVLCYSRAAKRLKQVQAPK